MIIGHIIIFSVDHNVLAEPSGGAVGCNTAEFPMSVIGVSELGLTAGTTIEPGTGCYDRSLAAADIACNKMSGTINTVNGQVSF